MGILGDVTAMVRFKWQTSGTRVRIPAGEADLQYCYDMLESVSRSFTAVIQQLDDPGLRDGICLFYLVLRALDTVEDDMSVPIDVKLRELPKFHTHVHDPEWCMHGVGEGRERELLEQYPRVSREFTKLNKGYQAVIEDICESMANGMCDFLQRPVVTKEDYDLYCHYVAGLVGHGLVRLFAQSGYEAAKVADDLTNANHMGLFLQKTNITRDYFEDIREEPPRMFWPKQIWGKYVAELADLKEPGREKPARSCLNEMVACALSHMPHVVDFMAELKDPSIFRFCAIPQVMAIATLAAVYNNPDTFQVKVKISKPEACRIMLNCNGLFQTLRIFGKYCDDIAAKLDESDVENTASIRRDLAAAKKAMAKYMQDQAPQPYIRTLLANYPGLGGRFLLTIVDNVAGYFGAERANTIEVA